jgi:hypothetical protein
MSREGANNRIDSLKNSLNHDHYNRTALGSAARFNVAVNLMYDFDNELSTNSFSNKEEFSALMDGTINTLLSEYDEAILDENNNSDISDTTQTLQQRLQNRAFKTALGQTVAKATTQRKGLYQDFNTSYSNGASGAFRSFTNGFVQDDEDFFGSRVLYDNVFGNYEDGTESLSNRRRLAMSDPLNDGRSVGEKVLDDVVNRSIYDQTEIIDRVDIEFGRFHGQSMIDQFSMTGSGLQTARRTIRNVMQEGSAYGRQVAARGESDDHPVTLAQALMDRTNEDLDSTKNALNLLNSNLGNRSSTTTSQDGGYVNKAGVAEFIDLINTAGTRDANGSLTGGRISISTFQFQNETISAALTDKIQRHVLESVLQGGGAPLQIDLTLAYPRQRNVDAKQDNDGRYAVGQTNYSILGPNLIEALKLEAVKEEIASMLQGLGISPDQIGNYVDFNVQFRDKKFHPKVYLTDNRASIGTQNLTAPVGRSINQAGSNFETMRFVDNSFVGDDVGLRTARQQFDANNKIGNTLNNSVTQSLLYRQIADSVLQEREFSNGIFSRGQGSTAAPIFSNQQGSQVGFAGDIFDHLRNTLDFAHTASMGYQNRAASQNSMHMFMILDQSFMLQLGSNSYSGQLKGEMGNETSNKPYSEKDAQAREYQKQQHKLFDLLINDSASVVVDTKNYKEGVLNPLLDRINNKDDNGNYTNEKLRSNFAKYGNSLTNMAGFELFRPSNASSSEDYDKSLNTMFSELRRLGFTKEAGFEDTDLKQIIGLASGNIEMAKAPRQHAKEAALVQYGSNGPELISYYQGSSNMGLYSLGVNSGENGLYQKGDGDLTNTEMGIMLGRRDINKGLSRAISSIAMTEDFKSSNNILGQNIGLQEWILNSEEEEYELALAQRHLSVTWNQLSQGTSITDPRNKRSIGTPGWQDNVNTTDLNILKSRLETMATDLGLSPKVFLISERYGNVSGKGITSINVSIDMAQMLNTGGFIQAGVSLPRLNFELTVLQGPSRGNGMFSDSADDGSAPGFVYFVDKDKVVGNGLFTNESSETISLLGRKNYNDNFESDIRSGGRINVKSGQSAHMSSLDIVPQLFATLMGEAVGRFGAGAQVNEFNNLDTASRQTLLLDYVSTVLTGRASQIDPDITEGSNIRSSMTQIKDNLNVMSLQELNETINRNARSLENQADSKSLVSSDSLQARGEAQELDVSLQAFNNKWFHALRKRGANVNLNDADVFSYISDLNNLASKSPQLANMIMRTSYNDPNATAKAQGFNQFQNLLFGSFYQTKDDRTYGGQQGFYRTLLMGVTSNKLDANSASLMFHLDETEGSLKNLNAYARFKPLEYNPLTNIHEMLYRSIASKSTSLTKNNSDLNSILLESEARDLGDAANLRLMSSIGIGNVMERDNFIVKNEQGDVKLGRDQKAIFEAMQNVMQASGQDTSAIDVARQAYLSSMSNEFGSLESEDRKDTIRLSFYTGSTKKLSQLPQRIKNAMGARPMYQYGILAQMALERGESLNDLSKSYIEKYRDPLVTATKNKVISLLEQREKYVINHGEDNDVVRNIDSTIDDLKVIGSKGFNSQIDGLGAVFKGHVKAVLNQEQVSFILKTRERLEKSLGDLIQKKELSEDLLEELIRVEIIKAGLTNKGLGKMISGSDHMKYSMAVVQLSGTYNDTFLANPLYGTTYKSKQDYDSIRNNEVDIYDKNLTAADRDNLGVYTLGQKEGQYETRQRSVKSSKMGPGGMQQLLEADDVVVQDKTTGLFVHKRKVNGKWQILSHADSKRNLPTISNLIDSNSFSPVGSSSLGSDTETIYAREGQDSINYIYSVDSREGNFANNEYLVTTGTLTSQDPSSGQRVEGTDTSALVKGVAMFAGRLKYKALVGNQITETEKNVFEDIEDQILKSYQEGNLGGSIKSYLDNADSTQRVELGDGRTGYSALSSSIHGVYNANNFKSFFWSHGAKILSSTNDAGDKFMLDGLFDVNTNATAQSNAKKLVGALMLNFGSSFIQETNKGELTSLKRSLVSEVVKGEFGSHYQQVALGYSQQIGSTLDSIFNDGDKRAGRTRGEIAQDLLFDKMQGSTYSDTRLGALNVLTSSQMQKVLQGDTEASKQILNLVKKGMLDPVADRASKVGGINFDNSADTQAALITTAVDFMHQLSSKGSKLRLPSDIDFDNRKVKEVLLAVIGLANNTDSELTEDIMQFLSGVNSDVTAVTVFTDITFAYGKDPTGTQSIGKHEAQHLITPFLGDIEKYQKGGKLGNLQHTVASLAAMVTKTESGLAFYDQMAKSGFSAKTAVNLVSEDSDYLFSSFNKEKFLGFYQNGVTKATTINYAKEYQKVNKGLVYGEYDWEGIQTVRDASDRTKFHFSDSSLQENSATVGIYQKVEQYVNRFYPQANDLEKARLVDKYLAMGGDQFAMQQLNELTSMMITENDKYQADPSKRMGMDSTGQFLENMDNKQMFFSIPDVRFETQNSEIVALPSSNLISTVLPSAADMRVLGGEYSGFVDPVIAHYKTLSSIFVPGTLTNSAFEKIRLSARDNRAIILSTEEYKAFEAVMNAATAMPLELQKASAGARTEEAFAGKNKYQGFTATGIGNMLMPFGSVVASQTKLDQAGLRDNSARLNAIKESNEKIRELTRLTHSLKSEDDYKNINNEEDRSENNISKNKAGTSTQQSWKVPRSMFGPPLPLYDPVIPSMTDEEKGATNNVLSFYKRQLKAETYGITSSLETNFNTMKLEAIQLKNEILDLQNLKGSLVQKQAAFLALEKSIRQKRDAAYSAARIDRKTGNVIDKSKEFSERTILEQDAYIYHAQALNYDVLLAETRLIAHNAGIQPLSVTVADRLTKKRDELSSVEFLLNSFEDKNSLPTFAGLSYKQSSVGQDAMFNVKGLTEEGMVGKHMKAIKQIGGAFKGLPSSAVEAQNAKLQYTLQQIESTIEMYKKRSEDMQKFSADREATVMSRNSSGTNEVDPDVQRRIDSASQEYRHSTEDIIAFLEDKKSKLLSSTATNTEIKQVFEDIDLKIAENDKANLAMAEVFRSPPLGGTDPRLHMYQLMQGVQSLNRVSQMLSDNREIGSQPKMIYSTERGQTATVMAALGVTTYGGGDWDGDAYTAIFTQMAPIQKAIQDHKIKLDKNTAVIDGLNKKKFDLVSKRGSTNRSTPEGLKTAEELTDRINTLDSNIADLQEAVRNDTAALNEAKSNLEKQIQAGHVNFQARARKQLSNYLGVDEAFFVQRGEVMFDAYGNTMMDEDGKSRVGLNNDKTLDGDALFALLDKGYNLIEGIASSSKDIVSIMNNVDIMLGHRGTSTAFNDGQFLSDLVKGTVINNGEISTASPAIGMLKSRVLQLQNSTSPLSDEEKMFVNSMKDTSDEHYKAYLQQFNTLSSEMEAAEAAVLKENQSLAAAAQKDFSKRAFINQWIGGNLYSAITSDKTLGKFMAQGNGMVLTEGTFDMTLKTLGKAGGEVLGKTYNTLVGTTFQDAPVITYGRQILEDGDLAQATKSEFSRQLEGDSEYISQLRQEVINEGINPSDPRFDQRVKQKIADQSQSKFEEYQELTRKAVLKSEGTQGFMKNIHQLLRDSIKLKEGGGDLIETLKNASSQYDELSRQIAANDGGEQDAGKRKDLVNARDEIISSMASKLGPGPGLKSLINLDYLTNESKSTGLSKNDFEQRFLTDGGIDNNREMLNQFSHSIKDLTDEERSQLRDPSTLGDESSALLKVARNMTANSLSNLVTSFRMDNSAAEGRGELVKDFARDHKASLATKLQTHSVSNIQTLASRTKDGTIDPTDEAGKYIRSKYGLIEVENASATFDANRQHKNALGIHLGVEERHMYNEDGTVTDAYRHKLTKAAEKIGVSNEEYTLMFDIHNEQSREQINGVFGQDGEKLEQFTVMNMMRKDIARSMMDGRLPGAEGTKTINDNIGSEVLTTMAQLAANGKLDSQGMDVFSGIYKGVMGNLLEATDSVVEYKDKESGEIRSMKFTEMTAQQKNAYMTKLVYQNMIGSENNSESGFNRSTSQEAKDWKIFNSAMIANSVLELDANGHLGNEFIDALDKAGASSSTGQQIEMYKQLGEEYLRESLDDEVQRNAILDQYLPNRGELSTKENEFYRDQLNTKIRSQMKYRQEQDSKKYTAARNRHGVGRGVLQRSSFMNKINSSALDQLSTDTSANALDLFVPLALTMVGTVISEGSVDKDQVMQLGGAMFTAFQYARTGTIESTKMDETTHKKRLATAQAMSGVFKFKNALAQQGEENVGAAVAQIAVQEVTAVAFNAIATPWLSKQIAEKGLGVKHAPALNSLEMRKYQASHQLAGNLGASLISAVSSTLISGLLMSGMESMSRNVGESIQAFMPVLNAVSDVNETISKRRQQEIAYAEFAAETGGESDEQEVKDYMVMTSSSYDADNYNQMVDLNEPMDLEPSSDGSLTVDLLV